MTDELKIRMQALALIQQAKELNLVLTIDLEPTKPLRMGQYRMVVGVRPARQPS